MVNNKQKILSLRAKNHTKSVSGGSPKEVITRLSAKKSGHVFSGGDPRLLRAKKHRG